MKRHTKIAMGLMAAKLLVLVFIAGGCTKVEEKTVYNVNNNGSTQPDLVVNDYQDRDDQYEKNWDSSSTMVSPDGKWRVEQRISSGTDSEFDLIGPNEYMIRARHSQAVAFAPDSSFIIYNANSTTSCASSLYKLDLTSHESKQITDIGVDCTDPNRDQDPNYVPWLDAEMVWSGHTGEWSVKSPSGTAKIMIDFDSGKITKE